MVALVVTAGCGGSDGPTPPGATTVLVKVAGDPQAGITGTTLMVSPTVEVRDGTGSPKAGVRVGFAVTSGGGAVTDTFVTTALNGRASTDWIMGPDAAVTHTMRANVGSVTADFSATATAPVAGQTYLGRAGYIEYIAGDLPIIITAPHGGTLRPTEIADRTAPGVLVRDTNTEELARAIGDALATRTTGRRPHVIINRLHRIKLDANREIVEAAQGQRAAQRAWYEFHAFTEAAKRAVVADEGSGFYIDLHGHGHAIARVELGYLLTFGELELSDAALNATTYANRSSIRTLSQAANVSFVELLRGPTSFGALLEAQSFSAVPSQSQPNPGRTGGVPNDYFNGGYNTARHGSTGGGTISGVQIETHFTGLRDNATSRALFGAALAAVLDTYLATHAGLDITS